MSRAQGFLRDLAEQVYAVDNRAIPRRGAVSSVTDLGELAVRLGSIVTFDRRGDVYWLDGFEEGISKWDTVSVGIGGGVALSASYARNGLYSCELTAGQFMTHYAEISRNFPYPTLSRWGFECHWSFDSDLDTLDVLVSVYDGTNLTTGKLRYDYGNQRLQYWDSDGAWQNLATSVDLEPGYGIFNACKLVLDLEEAEYERVIVNESEYDMEGVALQQGASAVSPGVKLGVRNTGDGSHNNVVYVDDVIITQNELGRSRTYARTLALVGSGS